MARGRKKDPVSVKATRGTLRKDRLSENAPEPSKRGMSTPAAVKGTSRGSFDLLHTLVSEMGNDSVTFGPALSLAALLLDEVNELTAVIRKKGRVYASTGRNGIQEKSSPYVLQLQAARRDLRSMLTEFGLTPASIQKVNSAKGREQENPFKDL